MPEGVTVGSILHLNGGGMTDGFDTMVVVEEVSTTLSRREVDGMRVWTRSFEGTNEYGTCVRGEYCIEHRCGDGVISPEGGPVMKKGTFTSSYRLNSYPWRLQLVK